LRLGSPLTPTPIHADGFTAGGIANREEEEEIMHVRLGDLLVARGVINETQRQRILAAQANSARPFGVIAEDLFGVDPQGIEQAWASQYASMADKVDPRKCWPAPDVLQLIERRQAWQFGLIPVRQDGPVLECVTAPDYLARAMRFAGWRVPMDCSFSICDRANLATALGIHYPIEGLDAAFVEQVMSQFVNAA